MRIQNINSSANWNILMSTSVHFRGSYACIFIFKEMLFFNTCNNNLVSFALDYLTVIFPITYKKGDETDCSNYRGITLLSNSFKILSNILLSRLTPYVDEIIGDHQCGFRRHRSTTNQIFCIREILEKKWEYNGTVHRLLIDFSNAYDSVRREVLYDIHIEFSIPRKLVRLI
jgi:hypothetical protein